MAEIRECTVSFFNTTTRTKYKVFNYLSVTESYLNEKMIKDLKTACALTAISRFFWILHTILSTQWLHFSVLTLDADSQPKSVGLVWGLAAAWRLVCIHRMNRVNSHNALSVSSPGKRYWLCMIVLLQLCRTMKESFSTKLSGQTDSSRWTKVARSQKKRIGRPYINYQRNYHFHKTVQTNTIWLS